MRKIYLLTGILCLITTLSFSQISLTGTTYNQDFNTLANTGNTNDLTIPGWLMSESGTSANNNGQYAAGTGSGNGGDTYSFGASGSTERAFGGLLSGTLTPIIGAYFVNNTGSTITSLTITYTGEQWRLGTAARQDRLDFQYSTDATSLSTGNWTDVDALDFSTPNFNGTAGAYDGNATGNNTLISSVITGLNIPSGASFYIRWTDFNASGADDGLAIDDFSLSTTGGGGPSGTVAVLAGNNASEPSTNGSFFISLSSPAPAGGVTVTYSLGGTATLNSDYTDPQAGTVTITPGNSMATVNMNVTDDADVEPAETIILTINTVTSPYTISTASASIDLLDDDVAASTTISLTTTPYIQNFNTLANTGTTSGILPSGWLFVESGSGANTTYGIGTGSSNSGNTYSFGASASTDRAFGGLQSGSVIPSIGAAITNNTGTAITRLGISYTGEQWRLGTASRTDKLDFQYSLDATDLSTGAWTDVDDLDFTSPNITASVGALDGNATGNNSLIAFTITGINIPAGATFYIRWNDFNASGADDGLAIDDITIEANPIDLVAPFITSLSPANGATDVSTNIAGVFTFNEPVLKGTGSIVVRKLSDNSAVLTLDVSSASVIVANATITFSIPGLAPNTAYYVEISNGAFTDLSANPFAGISGNSTWAFTTGTTFYVAGFNTCSSSLTDGFTQFSVTGDIVWGCTPFGRDPLAPAGTAQYPYGVQINGFAGGTNVPNVDWLISPSFDLTGTTYPLLEFWSRTAFNGLPLELKVSTDYVSGDPTLATWTDINGKFPSQTSNVWTLSENINLTAFKQSNVHFAFVYTSTPDDGARWTLDDVKLINSPVPPPPSLTVSTTDIQYPFTTAGSSSDKTFVFIGNDLTGDVTLNVSGNFLISKTGSSFGTSLTYTQGEANNIPETVYVRFAPSQNNQDFTGNLSISTSSLTSEIGLKGTSIDPATTLEVVNWNLEWFGSTSLGPTNDNQQEQNIKTILQSIGADVYGLVEVVDEARLANVVSQMPGYSYVICDYGSHTNTNESGFSPLSEAQKEAFVYKTSLLSNITTEPLLSQGTNSLADLSNPAYNYWSSGRFPYMMTADVTLNCVTKKIRFVLVHAKANTSPTTTSYQRRKAGADTLYYTLNQLYPNDNIIILGDFNDDLDQSITAGFTTTSWNIFTDDAVHYEAVTLPLSLSGKKSTVSYNDIIDHVVISNDLHDSYIAGSANILNDVAGLVSNYGSTTTDHYPAFSRYIFRNTTAPVVTTCTPQVSFCMTETGSYTVPAFVATDDCGKVNYSYTITGATERTGNSSDASGAFNAGTSIITWTATDDWGNAVQCQTTVMVNANPSVIIPDVFALPSGTLPNTVYIGYAPASSVTLTAQAAGGTPSYTYNWSNSTMGASTTVSPTVNSVYMVIATDANGCTATATKAITVKDVRGGKKLDKVIVCHNGHTIEINDNAVPAHLNHGDMLGGCESEAINTHLVVRAAPNPSPNEFTMYLVTNNASDNITLKVVDLFGRIVEQKQLAPGTQNFKIGKDYRPGLYFVEVKQDGEREIIPLLKLFH